MGIDGFAYLEVAKQDLSLESCIFLVELAEGLFVITDFVAFRF